MAATYQCPTCGLIIPVMSLDEGAAPHCPTCDNAVQVGAPPMTPPVAPSVPPPPTTIKVSPLPLDAGQPPPFFDEPPTIDVPRWERPVREPPRRASTGGSGRIAAVLVVVGIIGVRACMAFVSHRPFDANFPRVQIAPDDQFVVPKFGPPDMAWQPQPDRVVQPATWSERLPGGLLQTRLLLAGPQTPRVGLTLWDEALRTSTFCAFDGDTGVPAGRLTWLAPAQPAHVSISHDGSRLAALLVDRERGEVNARFRVYSLPAGDVVVKDWYPFPQPRENPPTDLWFAMLGPDRLLTVSAGRHLELWALPAGNRLYAVDVDAVPARSAGPIAISRDRRKLAVVTADWRVAFFDTATGKQQARSAPLDRTLGSLLNDCAFSPDGTQLGATFAVDAAHPDRETAWLSWSPSDGRLQSRWTAPSALPWYFWDNEHVVMPQGRLVQGPLGWFDMLYDAKTGNELRPVSGRQFAISDGRRLWYASNSGDLPPATQVVAVELRPDLLRAGQPNGAAMPPLLLTTQGFAMRGQ